MALLATIGPYYTSGPRMVGGLPPEETSRAAMYVGLEAPDQVLLTDRTGQIAPNGLLDVLIANLRVYVD